jgi:hypothetical protein
MKRNDFNVSNTSGSTFRVMFNLVFLLVEFTFTKEVVNRFVVLIERAISKNKIKIMGKIKLRSQGTGPPFYIPILWSSSLLLRGTLDLQHVGSYPMKTQSAAEH